MTSKEFLDWLLSLPSDAELERQKRQAQWDEEHAGHDENWHCFEDSAACYVWR